MKKFSVFLSFCLLLATVLCFGALAAPVLDTVEAAQENTVSAASPDDGNLLAAGEIVPGLNILTGTAEPETFESFSINETTGTGTYTYAPGLNNSGVDSFSVVSDTTKNSKVLKIASSKSYPYFRWKFALEAKRPIYVAYDVKNANTSFWIVGFTRTGDTQSIKENIVYNPRSFSWLTGGNKNVFSTTLKQKNTWDSMQVSLYSNTSNTFAGFQFDKGDTSYIDNVSWIPYYKITCYSPDGNTVLYSEYVLLNSDGSLMTSYTPAYEPLSESLLGWSTTPDSDTIEYEVGDTVPLANADITLYAVLNTEAACTISYDANTPALAVSAVSGMPQTPVYADKNKALTLSTAVPTVFGFTFKGWSTEKKEVADCDAADLITTYMPTEDTTLYAVWDYDYTCPSTMGVEFDEPKINNIMTTTSVGNSTQTISDGCAIYKTTGSVSHPRYTMNLTVLYPKGIPVEYNRQKSRVKINPNTNQPVLELSYNSSTSFSVTWFFAQEGATSGSIPSALPTGFVERTISVNRSKGNLTTLLVNVLRKTATATGDTPAYIDYIRFYRTGDKTLTYYTNDGTETVFAADTKAAVGTGYRLTGDTPTRDGYTFMGWATSKENAATETDLLAPSAAIAIKGDVMLYASWRKNGDVKLSYDLNAPAFAVKVALDTSSEIVAAGSPLTATATEEIGLRFMGWSESPLIVGTYTEEDLIKTAPNSDTTLYAVWDYDVTAEITRGLEFDDKSKIEDSSNTSYVTLTASNGMAVFTPTAALPPKIHPRYKIALTEPIPVEYKYVRMRAKISNTTTQACMALCTDSGFTKPILQDNSDVLWFQVGSTICYDFMEKSGVAQNITGDLSNIYINPLRAGQPAVTDIADSAYIDYIRFYRTGDKTVTYYTNDDTDSVFRTDSQAAVGTGYLLTGDAPTRNGYIFLGWGTEPDAVTPVTSIDITKTSENALYAIWKSVEPTTLNLVSVRATGKAGLRFAALMELDVRSSAGVEEYGFLITRESLLTAKGCVADDLKFGSKAPNDNGTGYTDEGVIYVSGANYRALTGEECIYDLNGTKLPTGTVDKDKNFGFTAVLTDIPTTEAYVNEVFVARPYIKINGSYYYGATHQTSLYQAAASIRASSSYESMTTEEKAYIDTILANGSQA